ncbi:hypothetical protein [Tessaracoccus coleopterorum]|uniref:hypothetical protein n=1 Tax=Tessaracoccus coleopterorum TaxID=2714950 RepID=UPI001E652634|nr:hypothetical protein [Tessaracoccus coleopterorum]
MEPEDLGFLSAFAAKALIEGTVTGAEGDKFEAGKLGGYTVGLTTPSCSAIPTASTRTTSTTSTSDPSGLPRGGQVHTCPPLTHS